MSDAFGTALQCPQELVILALNKCHEIGQEVIDDLVVLVSLARIPGRLPSKDVTVCRSTRPLRSWRAVSVARTRATRGESSSGVDKQLVGWLKQAYDAAG